MIERVRSSVVRIETNQGNGSGFIFETPHPVGTALILTNAHVIEGADWIDVTVNDSTTFRANMLGIDVYQDLAVLKICCGQFRVLKFGDAGRLEAGVKVVAIGYALGISGRASVSDGIVSALRYEQSQWVIQTDAAINPGNSGGPLLSTSGEVLGINTYKYEFTKDGRPGEGLGFAISEVTLEDELPGLKAGLFLLRPTPTPTPLPPRFILRINMFPCCENNGYIDVPGGKITVSPLPDGNKTYAENTKVTLTIVKYSRRYGGRITGTDSFEATDWGGTAIVIMNSERRVTMQFFIS